MRKGAIRGTHLIPHESQIRVVLGGVRMLVWDNASWHVSQRVRAWLKMHNRRAKREGGVRIIVCQLPVKAPWLNPIEPRWVHGKRAIMEADRVPAAQEVKERVCEHY